MTCLGKIIGGGLPVGAFGGKRAIMEKLAPRKACVSSGHVIGQSICHGGRSCHAQSHQAPGFHAQLTERTQQFLTGLQQVADKHGIGFTHNSVGAMFGIFFTEKKPFALSVMSPTTARGAL